MHRPRLAHQHGALHPGARRRAHHARAWSLRRHPAHPWQPCEGGTAIAWRSAMEPPPRSACLDSRAVW